MAFRILVLKPLYGCALVTQLDGSIQLQYNTTHTPDEAIFNWIKEIFDKHTEHVEQNQAAEMRAAVPAKPVTVASIIAPVVKPTLNIPREYPAAKPPVPAVASPAPINPPGQDHTFIGGRYRIGRQCVVCHQTMTGNEGKCPGEVVIAPPEEPK